MGKYDFDFAVTFVDSHENMRISVVGQNFFSETRQIIQPKWNSAIPRVSPERAVYRTYEQVITGNINLKIGDKEFQFGLKGYYDVGGTKDFCSEFYFSKEHFFDSQWEVPVKEHYEAGQLTPQNFQRVFSTNCQQPGIISMTIGEEAARATLTLARVNNGKQKINGTLEYIITMV